MKGLGALILVLAIGAMGLDPAASRPDAPNQGGAAGSEFFAMDVIVDSGAAGLGAYQVEITPRSGGNGPRVQLVGIEGGEVGAFAEPPAYDAAALHRTEGFDRVILAAFSTGALLPVGEARVARVHFHGGGGAEQGLEVRLVAAGGTNARSIPATAHLSRVRTDTDIHNSRDDDDREGASR